MPRLHSDAILNDSHVTKVGKYFDDVDSINANTEYVVRLKRKAAAGNLALAIVLVVISVAAT